MAGLRLRVVHHDGVVEERALEDGSLGVGRAADNWLAPLDQALSRRHARLEVVAGAVWVEPLPTPNGTRVNGELIAGRRRLAPGDRVLLGRTVLELALPGPAAVDGREQPTVELEAEAAAPVAISPAMRAVLANAGRFAASPLPVLLTGESGTGKEVVARFIHASSPRRDRPFVVLNCPALPSGLEESELFGVEAGVATGVSARRGRLELADRGTLLLDEVADLSAEAQAKLLRFLQDGSCERVGGRKPLRLDVRVLAATNRPLEPLPARFRADLYYRLAALRLHLPPLRERREDVLPLVERTLRRLGAPHLRLEAPAREELLGYPFPGNVRELEAIVGRAALLAEGGAIRLEHLGLSAAAAEAEGPGERADRLLAALERGEVDFWQAVYRPFAARELPRALVQELVALGLARGDGSVRALAATFGVGDRYRKLLDFLRNNRLLPGREG